jgi:hypothetical protein
MPGGNENKSNTNGSNKLIILLVILLFIVVVALVVVLVFAFGKKDKESEAGTPATQGQTQKQREVLVTEDNVQEVLQQLEEEQYTPPGYYTVTQNYDWHFPSGKEASTDAHVENAAENTNDVYFDLYLADNSEEPIYKSPIIPLGATLEGFKLDTELSAGTYDCIIEYHLCDENQNTLSTVSMTVTVIVEK